MSLQGVDMKAVEMNAAEPVLLLGIDTGEFDAEESLKELSALAQANEMLAVAEVLQKRQKPDGATVLGAGRLEEARQLCDDLQVECAVFDGELSGSQLRNISNLLKVPVIDRTMLILSIFKNRAVTREGKTQTELATLEYRLPRLSGLGQELSRQGGGGGGGAGARRGGGETRLEYDRRYIRGRISVLKKRLQAMQGRRDETRKRRDKSEVPLVALVGYTNAGKSTLLNALTGSDIAAADRLFETLDPTARRLCLPNGQEVVLIDTVGFVSRLPHKLVQAFKSTLEEACYADLLLLVCDAAGEQTEMQLAVTEEVLASLKARGKQLVVYNKCDKIANFSTKTDGSYAVSALTGFGFDTLLQGIEDALQERVRSVCLRIPYEELALAELLRKHGAVQEEHYTNKGVEFKAVVETKYLHYFKNHIWQSEDTNDVESI